VRPEDFLIEDIAHHLSLINRFTGATEGAFSVAQHCLNCSLVASTPAIAYEALMHDRAEAYLSDINSPVKQCLPDYKRLEKILETVSAETFNIPAEMSAEVKEIDLRMLVTEASLLMRPGVYPWWEESHWPKPYPAHNLHFFCMSPTDVEMAFLSRYEELRLVLGHV